MAADPQLSLIAMKPAAAGAGPLVSGFGSTVYSPSQVQKAYGFNLAPNQGQGETVGIVDAYGDPNIVGDASVFSSQFGLPQMNGVGGNPILTVIQQTPGNTPPAGSNWALETALDVEWVHSVAPMANIVLVETTDNSYNNLLGVGIPTAQANGAVVISNSYGGGEFSSEASYDSAYLAGPSQSAVLDFSTGDNARAGRVPGLLAQRRGRRRDKPLHVIGQGCLRQGGRLGQWRC